LIKVLSDPKLNHMELLLGEKVIKSPISTMAWLQALETHT